MDRTVQKYVEAIEQLYNQNMGAPTVQADYQGTRYLVARDGRVVLWLSIRNNLPGPLPLPEDHTCRVYPKGKGIFTIFCKYPEQYPDAGGRVLPTKQVVNQLKRAVPAPLEDVWVVVEQGRVVELLLFTNTTAGYIAGAGYMQPFLVGLAEEGRKRPLCSTINSLKDLRPFWRFVKQGKLAPGREILRKTDLKFGNTPDEKEGGLIVDGRLFMHPDDRKHYPNLTARDLVNVKDSSDIVKGGPGTMRLFYRR